MKVIRSFDKTGVRLDASNANRPTGTRIGNQDARVGILPAAVASAIPGLAASVAAP